MEARDCTTIKLQTLGGLELRDSQGRELRVIFAAPKRAALLTYLAIAIPRGFHRRDKLLALLWPELDQEHARGALRQTLHLIRRSMTDGALLAEGDDKIALDRDVFWCDAVAFERLLDEGRLEEALALYQGDLLEAFHLSGCVEFERWLEDERRRLKQLAAEAAWSLAQQAVAEGRTAPAALWGRRALAFSPYDEAVLQRLIELLDRVGDRAGAIREYQAFATRLQQDYEAEPAPETTALIESVRSRVQTNGSVLPSAPVTKQAVGVGATTHVPTLPRRRRVRSVVVGGLAVVFAVGVYANWGDGSSQTPSGVQRKLLMVTAFVSEMEEAAPAGLGLSASNRVAEALSRSGLVQVVPASVSARWRQVVVDEGVSPDDPSVLRATAAQTGAALYLAGSYTQLGDSVHFRARVMDVKTGKLLRAILPVAALHEKVGQGMRTLQERITGAVGTVVDPRFEDWAGAASLPPDLESYRRYSAAAELYIDGHLDSAVTGFLDAAAGHPAFTAPVIWAALARTDEWYKGGRFIDSKRDEAESLIESLRPLRDGLPAWDRAMLAHVEALLDIDFPAAHRAIREAVEAAPGAMWYLQLARMCLWLDRPHELLEVLSRFEADASWLEMRRPRYWGFALWANHRLGDYEQELKVARSLKGGPDAGQWLYFAEMRALIGQQRDEEVFHEFELLVASDNRLGLARVQAELRAHGYQELADRAAARVVEILDGQAAGDRDDDWKYLQATYRLYGQPEEARAQLEEIPADSPRYLDALGLLGPLAAGRGEREEALRMSTALEREQQASLRYLYQAAIAAALGERERAVSLLRRKESPPRGIMHRELWFPTLRDYPPFHEVERPHG